MVKGTKEPLPDAGGEAPTREKGQVVRIGDGEEKGESEDSQQSGRGIKVHGEGTVKVSE